MVHGGSGEAIVEAMGMGRSLIMVCLLHLVANAMQHNMEPGLGQSHL